jgi:quinoprotein glucose dehydrogenase
MKLSRLTLNVSLVAMLVAGAGVSMRGQWTPKVGEWPTYGADLASTRYSPLDQINASNFSKLQLALI